MTAPRLTDAQARVLAAKDAENAALRKRITRLEAALRECVDDHQPQKWGRCSCGARVLPCPVRAEIDALLTEPDARGAS